MAQQTETDERMGRLRDCIFYELDLSSGEIITARTPGELTERMRGYAREDRVKHKSRRGSFSPVELMIEAEYFYSDHLN